MKKDRGFIGIIVLIIIALLALKYLFGWSIFQAAGTPEGQGTLSYFWDIIAWVKQALLTLWGYLH